MNVKRFGLILLSGALLVGVSSSQAQSGDPLGTAEVLIQGNLLTIDANDVNQTINVGERARVQTCYGGPSVPCGSIPPDDPLIAGLKVMAELSGPELPQPIPMETVPGGAFVLPSFQQQGFYRLGNIRLVNAASEQVIGEAVPSVAVLQVSQIVLTSATVTTLSLADLQARGISLTQENFQAFNFAVGFAFDDEIVTIDLPVLYTGSGQVEPLDKPQVHLEGVPEEIRHTVSRWTPPQITVLELSPRQDDLLEENDEDMETLSFPMFGAIVLPGNVSYLNQFFDARLVVANGAPNGSQVTLENLNGTLRLPSGNVLRLAETIPPVALGQPLPVIREDHSRIIPAGEQGSAVWTVEGLVAGTHVLDMDITGELARPGRDPLPVASRAKAAVEIVDARFNLTFSHPDVVRTDEPYVLYVTVTNLSRAAQNLISVEIRDEHMAGAHKADPYDNFVRTIETLEPGQAETVEYELVADLTGKVVATTFQSSSSAGEGTIQLYTGVGELGIPLSPATLVLPRFSNRLATPHTPTDDFFRANVRLLGLAYSLAVAPAGMAPSGLPAVIRSDVERRAIDLGEAGQRTYLKEELLESLEVLALDQLGNRHPLVEYDELRRRIEKGLLAAVELGALLRHEQQSRTLDAEDFFDHFIETTSYASPYLAATLLPGSFDPAPALEIRQTVDSVETALAGTSDDPEAVRTLAFGEIYAIRETFGGADTVPFALVGHVEDDATHQLVLRNDTDEATAGRLLAIVPDASGGYRRLDFGTVTVPPHTIFTVEVGAALTSFALYNQTAGATVPGGTPSAATVVLPPFRLIGAVQDIRLTSTETAVADSSNRYGNGLSYLFNRPPDPEAARVPGNYRIESTLYNALDVHDDPLGTLTSEKVGKGAYVQPSGRVVNVRYSTPLSALVDELGDELLVHTHELDTVALTDRWGNPLSADVPPPRIDTNVAHTGGLVKGRVLRGTGEGVADATVKLIRLRDLGSVGGVARDLVGVTTTDDDGTFFFDFVEQPHWHRTVFDQFTLRAYVPPGDDPLAPAEVEEVSSVIRHMNRVAEINIALLGRGTVKGRLLELETGLPVADGEVLIASTLFDEVRSTEVGADGSFVFAGVPVGPLTLTGRDPTGRRVYATVGLGQPGAVVEVTLELAAVTEPQLGTVEGTVYRQPSGDPLPPLAPVAGAEVMVWSAGQPIERKTTDELGRFRFTDVPAGQVTLQAADWRISRTPAVVSLWLAGYETAEATLTIPESAPRTVTGKVFFHDPYTNTDVEVEGAAVAINGPGVFTYTAADGGYRLEGVPVQGAYEDFFKVTAVDFERGLQGIVTLPWITDASPEEIQAQPIVLAEMRGGIDGVVLNPLGQPQGGVSVVVPPWGEETTGPDGSFSFDHILLGDWSVVAHVGDGLKEGKVGYIGDADATIVFGGHRPFVSIRLRGSGVVRIHTRTATATGVMTPIYYRPTYYSDTVKGIRLRGKYLEDTTDPNGTLELTLPVGAFEVVAYNPFHGVKEIHDAIEFPGQVVDLDIVFEEAATVRGTVVDVDGTTPVPNAPVVLKTAHLLPQTQVADAQGGFQFELVPKGSFAVTTEALVGQIERVGRTNGLITMGGQSAEVTVRLRAQGTVRGAVMEEVGGDLIAIKTAQYYLVESGYPNRRLPSSGWYTADQDGKYEVAHVYAGRVRVVARDPVHPSRRGYVFGEITADWQVVEMPKIVMMTAAGSIGVVVRDPDALGGPTPDCQVRLTGNSFSEMTVSDIDGQALFEALPLGTYSVYAFHAPTGRSGRLGNLQVTADGEHVEDSVYLELRGEIHGTLFDDEAKLYPVGGGIVELGGTTAGGYMTALASTSSASVDLGQFAFLGIPEGHFDLEAGTHGSNRRALAEVDLTETAPIVDVHLVLEPEGDVYFRLFERLIGDGSGVLNEINPNAGEGGLYSVRLRQGISYDYTQLEPEYAYPGHVFHFPHVLLSRGGTIEVHELNGEQRSKGTSLSNFLSSSTLAGSGTLADPYQLVLHPKGVVRVSVEDIFQAPVIGASVTLTSGSAHFPSVTGDDGSVTFSPVPAGTLRAVARASGTGGTATATLTYDDQTVDMTVQLAASVAAHGIVYQPTPDDRDPDDPGDRIPQAGAIVIINDASTRPPQTMATAADGTYHFEGLITGPYSIAAQDESGQAWAEASGNLSGTVNELPALVLDASPPRVVSISPPPAMEDVSLLAVIEIVFSEPLRDSVVPHQQAGSSYFRLRNADGDNASGIWDSTLDGGRQVVTFVPSQPYDNVTVYTLTIQGGASGVCDRAGRLLTSSGNIGSNFKTADQLGPVVIATVPSIEHPVDPAAALRFDFNEAVTPAAGVALADTAWLEWRQLTAQGPQWKEYPLRSVYLTRSNYSLTIEPYQGVVLDGDTRQRRITLAELADEHGNVMEPWNAAFVVYDGNAPHVDELPYPDGVTGGNLTPGTPYVLTPDLSGIDGATAENPGGDLERVDYFFSEPVEGTAPAYSATVHPFAYEFIAAYSGDGVEPWPFNVWCRAVDTSTNESNVASVEMQVLPNQAPTIGAVDATGTFYVGSTVAATVTGLADEDGIRLTLSVELYSGVSGVEEELVAQTPGRTVLRPDSEDWADLAPQSFEFALPLTLDEATPLFFRAIAIDSARARDEAETAFTVAADAVPPVINGLEAIDADDALPGALFFIGDAFLIEFRAFDSETGVESVEVSLDRTDIFTEELIATRVSGTENLYRTNTLTVPPNAFTEATAIAVTVSAHDYGSNTETETLTFQVAPEADPTVPTVTWLTPWEAAAWPADYESPMGGDAGTALLLRVRASDTTLNAQDQQVPGTIAAVEFRGPELDAQGEVVLSAEVPGTLVAGTGGPGTGVYELVWQVPNEIPAATAIPFEVRVFDTGNKSVVQRIRMEARAMRRVYEGITISVTPTDPMLAGDPEGPVFLLDGAKVSVYPADGELRSLPSVYLYAGGAGGSVLTAPEINSYASAKLFYPLELEVTETLAVGAECRIDMSGRGPLGSTSDDSMVVDWERGAAPRAGGSHGGAGWYGSANNRWDRVELAQPGSVYDSVRDPRLPGGGGAGWDTRSGGDGGSVARIFADGAVVRLVGDLRADGGSATGSGKAGGGGAGGAIRLVAGRLEGGGRITANGGHGSHYQSTGGGGGGRIAVAWRELGDDFDPASQIEAIGGHNAASNPGYQTRRGGAGTIYLEALDPATGEASGIGELIVRNPADLAVAVTPLPALGDGTVFAVDPLAATVTLEVARVRGELAGDRLVLELDDGTPIGIFPITAQERIIDAAAPGGGRVVLTVTASEAELTSVQQLVDAATPVLYHGRARYAALAGEDRVRVAIDDDLEIGAVSEPQPALNQRASLDLDPEARALLRTEGPEITITADPAAGTAVPVSSAISLSWTVSDPLGFALIAEDWSPADPTVERLTDEPPAVSSDPFTRSIPGTATDEVSYTVEATDLHGRTVSSHLTWTVLPNAEPTGTLRIADGASQTVKSGFPTAVEVEAQDAEGLALVTLTATAPATQGSQQTVVTGTDPVVVPFTVGTAVFTTAEQTIELRAFITDTSDATVERGPLAITVTPNELPVASVAMAAGGQAVVKPGQSAVVTVHGEDPDGLSQIELGASAPATVPNPVVQVSGTPQDVDFHVNVPAGTAEGTIITLSATVTDAVGLESTATLELEVITNAPPEGVLAFAAGTPAEVYPGTPVTVVVDAEDLEGLKEAELFATGPATVTAAVQPLSGTADQAVFEVVVAKTALATDTVAINVEVRDLGGGTWQAENPLSLGILADTGLPVVTVTGVDAVYYAGQTLTATLEVSDEVGASELEVAFDGEIFPVTGEGPIYAFTTVIDREIETPRTTQFVATATDYAGNEGSSDPIAVELRKDEAPEILNVAALPDTEVLAGTTIEVTVDAGDDVGLETMVFDLTGAVTHHEVRTLSGLSAQEIYQRTLPTTLAAGAQIYLTIDVTDSYGHTESSSVTFTILADEVAPTVEIELVPETGNVYTAGDDVDVIVTAADNVAVTEIRLTLGGVTSTSSVSPLVYHWQVPGVGGSMYLPIAAEASDPSSNVGTASRTVLVQPLDNEGIPTVRFDCPSTGAYLPSGYDNLILQVSVDDDEGVNYVEFFAGTEQVSFETVTPASGIATSQPQTLPVVTGEEVVTYRARVWDFATNFAEAMIEIHVVETVDLSSSNAGALADELAVLRSGTLTLSDVALFRGLIVLRDASITQPASAPGAEEAVMLSVETAVYLECGAKIDVIGKGYPANTTYPGATLPEGASGGSHIGYGGVYSSGAPGSSFGSVYQPLENGGGGQHGRPGGGVVRIVADRVTVDGEIRVDGGGGGWNGRGGAGGSAWITTGEITGNGWIRALGGWETSYGAGGGGSIAIDYLASSGLLLDHLRVQGGDSNYDGGAGTIYLRGPEAVYGNLVIDNGTRTGEQTVLPALGHGEVLSASGALIEIGCQEPIPAEYYGCKDPIPAYFAGHWVEFTSPQGELVGAWRIASVDGTTLTLETDSPESIPIQATDLWQGVYLFDACRMGSDVQLESADPVRCGISEITGTVETTSLIGEHLWIREGAELTPPAGEALEIELSGDLVIETGGMIELFKKGYGPGWSHPDADPAVGHSGASHMGYGATYNATSDAGSTYGSVYRPQEKGAGGVGGDRAQRGGGAVRITAASLVLEGTAAIRANGGSRESGYAGAGGSVWIATGAISGTGVIQAYGGWGDRGSGGGGAIAIEYASISAEVLANLRAQGGSRYSRNGGAGTIYLKGPAAVYGDLVVDNRGVEGLATELPALGSGNALEDRTDGVLVIDHTIPQYFVGHWVELTGDDGTFLRRIGKIEGTALTLAGDPITITSGDDWQGVYLFDDCRLGDQARLVSNDPVRCGGTYEITDFAETATITAGDLRLREGAVLTSPAGHRQRIDLTGELVIETGAAIDVTKMGYGPGQTYPDADPAVGHTGASHMGYGVPDNATSDAGSTYGSVYRPQEMGAGGAGGDRAQRGGGAVHITAASLVLEGTAEIRANGGAREYGNGGAGGAVWITTGAISGTGFIEAYGGWGDDGSGGGGAIAIEYTSIAVEVLANLKAQGGSRYSRKGGAGTIYLKGPAAFYGELVVDNRGIEGEATELPALGSGAALGDSHDEVLVTDRETPIPDYFVGHWVVIADSEGTPKDTWRVGAVDDRTIVLVPNDKEPISIEEGDLWQGVYRFDSANAQNGAVVISVDTIDAAEGNL